MNLPVLSPEANRLNLKCLGVALQYSARNSKRITVGALLRAVDSLWGHRRHFSDKGDNVPDLCLIQDLPHAGIALILLPCLIVQNAAGIAVSSCARLGGCG